MDKGWTDAKIIFADVILVEAKKSITYWNTNPYLKELTQPPMFDLNQSIRIIELYEELHNERDII
jgi:hypothetical protein